LVIGKRQKKEAVKEEIRKKMEEEK